MAKFESKAEEMFETKVQHGINFNNWTLVEETTRQYEAHLKLIEPMCSYELKYSDEVGDIPICTVHGNNSKHNNLDPHRSCLTVDPYTKAVEPRPTDDPTVIEEQTALLDGTIEAVAKESVFPWRR